MSVTKMDTSLSPPPFLTKTFDIVDDCHTDSIVSWSPSSDNSFVVWDLYQFSGDVLPHYFKHNNFSSFIRQLNNYGFRKADPDRWEFSHDEFRKGERNRLKNIHRKRPAVSSKCLTMVSTVHPFARVAWKGIGTYQALPAGVQSETEQLKNETIQLTLDFTRLSSERQAVRQQIKYMSDRLQALEMSQQQIFAFIARSLQCAPSLFYQYMHEAIAEDRISTQLNPLVKTWKASDANSSEARKQPCILNADLHLCKFESTVSVNYNNSQLHLQPPSGKVLAGSCTAIQDTGMWITTRMNDNETSASYEQMPVSDHTYSKLKEEDNASATSIYQTADWSQAVEGNAYSALSSVSVVEDLEMEINTCTKLPVIKVNGPTVMDRHPLTLPDGSLSFAGTCIGNGETQVPQESSNYYCQDLESELFWENLMSPEACYGDCSRIGSDCAFA